MFKDFIVSSLLTAQATWSSNPEYFAYALLAAAVAAYVHMEILFLFYCAGMNLEKVDKTVGLTKEVKFITAPLVLIAPLINFSFTVVWGTIIFFDLPREGAFSNRLGRYCSDAKYEGTRRRKMALWFAHRIINPHDFWGGLHIKGS